MTNLTSKDLALCITKRLMDVIISLVALAITSPVILVFLLLVWIQDFKSPLYVSVRIAKNGQTFKMLKIRSMTVGADKAGIDSTSHDDLRITKVGAIVRRYKVDELFQLINVLTGSMSLVGPRPNVPREVALYTKEEQGLLLVRPGITDFSSIVFSDEGKVLSQHSDPDLAYHQLIRPWKSRLGLFYISKMQIWVDLQILYLTFISLLSRRLALKGVSSLLRKLEAPSDLVRVALREVPLLAAPPPGATEIVTSR